MDRKSLLIILVSDVVIMIFALSLVYSRYIKNKQEKAIFNNIHVQQAESRPSPDKLDVSTEQLQATSQEETQNTETEVKTRNILFQYKSSNAQKVALIGNFSNWVPENMKKEGVFWKVVIKLKPGEYRYNYLVDGKVILDPNNKKPAAMTKQGHKSSSLAVRPLE